MDERDPFFGWLATPRIPATRPPDDDGLLQPLAEGAGLPRWGEGPSGTRTFAGLTKNPHVRGKIAFVNGSGQGIGECIARELTRAGAEVIVNPGPRYRLRGNNEAHPARASPAGKRVQVDVTSPEAVETLIGAIRRDFKALDIVVNVCEGGLAEPFLAVSQEDWNRELAYTLEGPLVVTRVAAREMVNQGCGGRIVNVLGSVEWVPGRTSGFALQKTLQAGLIAFSQAVAVELAPFDITVNAVVPGVMESQLEPNPEGKPAEAELLGRIPKGRYGHPADVAAVVLFLVSNDADYCTGARFVVDGGLSSADRVNPS